MSAIRVKLISAKLHTGFMPTVTKPDKRYKKGYRVISEGYTNYQLRLRTTNPKGQLRVGQTVQTPWGQYRVIINNFLSLDGESEMIQCCMVEKGCDFEFNAEFDILPLVFTIGEGSVR